MAACQRCPRSLRPIASCFSLVNYVSRRTWASYPWDSPWVDEGESTDAPGRRLQTTSDYEQLRSNWAENVLFQHKRLLAPTNVNELQETVCKYTEGGRKVRALGSGHSFNDCAASGDTMISTAYLATIYDIDVESMTVRLECGVTYGQLIRFLDARGCALKSMPSLPQVTVAGAVCTASHGSGVLRQNVVGDVAAIRTIGSEGRERTLVRGTEEFEAAAVLTPAIVSEITLDVVPAYDVHQRVYADIDLEVLLAHLVRSANRLSAVRRSRTGPRRYPHTSYFANRQAASDNPGKRLSVGLYRLSGGKRGPSLASQQRATGDGLSTADGSRVFRWITSDRALDLLGVWRECQLLGAGAELLFPAVLYAARITRTPDGPEPEGTRSAY